MASRTGIPRVKRPRPEPGLNSREIRRMATPSHRLLVRCSILSSGNQRQRKCLSLHIDAQRTSRVRMFSSKWRTISCTAGPPAMSFEYGEIPISMRTASLATGMELYTALIKITDSEFGNALRISGLSGHTPVATMSSLKDYVLNSIQSMMYFQMCRRQKVLWIEPVDTVVCI